MSDAGPIMSLADLAAQVPDGASLAITREASGVAIAGTLALIRRGVRDLHVICIPTAGLSADLLIGAGCVRSIETSGVSLGEYGGAPRFNDAVRQGRIGLQDATCPAVLAALQAGEKGVPFATLRGLIGSDILLNRPDWKVIDNPFLAGDRIVALPAIRPDIALFHAPLADTCGNVWIGRQRELVTLAHAARTSIVTVEEIRDTDLMADEVMAAGLVPAHYVGGVALAARGAWPTAMPGLYDTDDAFMRHYAELARSEEGFARVLDRLLGTAAAAAAE